MAETSLGLSPGAVRRRLRAAVSLKYSHHHTSLSFALGVFLIALPNLGVSLVIAAAIGYRVEWANPLALAAAAVVMNPLIKTGVYATSFGLGTVLLGPVPGVFSGQLGPSIGLPVLVRLLVGNVILATGFAVSGYFLTLYSIRTLED